MSKRKLTDKQNRQVAAMQEKRAEADALTGMLITRFGANAIVANADWVQTKCRFRQNLPEPAPGDEVLYELDKHGHGVITAIQPRKTLLTRASQRGDIKPLAANVSQMIITIACSPEPSSDLIDRYLIAAHHFGFKTLIVANKSDLGVVEELLSLYDSLGFKTLTTSASEETNLTDLQTYLDNEMSIFVGQSGVGKSSIINALLPEIHTRVGETSDYKGHGKHTTTRTSVFKIPTGGFLIDSPGVRQFRLVLNKARDIAGAYPDIQQFADQCQFRDCQHDEEPNCAVKTALEAGDIHPQRWMNFQHILENK